MPDDQTATAASQDCICGHEWEAHYGGGCDYEGCGCRRYPTPATAAYILTTHTEEGRMDIDVTECPDCNEKGRWDGRVMIGGRGIYTCPNGHRWQDANEKPTDKGVPIGRSDV